MTKKVETAHTEAQITAKNVLRRELRTERTKAVRIGAAVIALCGFGEFLKEMPPSVKDSYPIVDGGILTLQEVAHWLRKEDELDASKATLSHYRLQALASALTERTHVSRREALAIMRQEGFLEGQKKRAKKEATKRSDKEKGLEAARLMASIARDGGSPEWKNLADAAAALAARC